MTRRTGWREGYLAVAPDLFHWSGNKTCLCSIGRAGYLQRASAVHLRRRHRPQARPAGNSLNLNGGEWHEIALAG